MRLIRLSFVLVCSFLGESAIAREGMEITDCDRYASSELSADRVSAGIPLDSIDPKLAIPACEEATRRFPDNIRIAFQLGRSYVAGGKFDEAMKQFKEAADRNYGPAMSSIGVLYVRGNGVTQNVAEAIKWYRKAAELGDAGGQLNLGLVYEEGYGVTKDYSAAFDLYQKSAVQGVAVAQLLLGNLYNLGRGVAKDESEALFWYKKAAAQGNDEAKKQVKGLSDVYIQQMMKILNQQRIEQYESYDSAAPLVAINGRPLRTTANDFGTVILNSLKQCDDLDPYIGEKGATALCKRGVISGFEDWVKVSKDRTISADAWNAGAASAVIGGPNPNRTVIDFSHWAGTARVAQSHLSDR
jgi:hypothetical protein